MIRATRPALPTTATVIVDATDSRHPGRQVTVHNLSGTNEAELGGPGFAAGAGYVLNPGQTLQLTLQAGDELAASSALGATLHVLVTGA